MYIGKRTRRLRVAAPTRVPREPIPNERPLQIPAQKPEKVPTRA